MLALTLATASFLFATPRVTIVQADTDASRGAILRPVAAALASSLFDPKSNQDTALLSATISRDLAERFSSRNRAENALFVAETSDAEVAGSVGIEVSRLTKAGLNEQQAKLRRDEFMDVSQPRPLLSNLAVSRDYRRRGIGKRLCRDAELAARAWGFDEVYLKVEKGNRKAFNLYRGLGYRVVATDPDAEKPIVVPGGIKYVKTTNVAMRKDLRFPPVDTALGYVAALGLAAAAAPKYEAIAQYVSSAVEAGSASEQPVRLIAGLIQGVVQLILQ